MDPLNLGIFQLAEQRLSWLDQRQSVLAQNVANVSTPGYRPKEMTPFAATLGQAGAFQAVLAQTAEGHLPGRAATASSVRSVAKEARSPDGNAVSVERQLGAIADTAGMQELALNLDHAYQTMFRTSFGRGS